MISKSHSMHPLLSAGMLSLQPNFQKKEGGGGMPCTAAPDSSSLSKNINSTGRVSRLSFRFL